jgi:hypothetical protein
LENEILAEKNSIANSELKIKNIEMGKAQLE